MLGSKSTAEITAASPPVIGSSRARFNPRTAPFPPGRFAHRPHPRPRRQIDLAPLSDAGRRGGGRNPGPGPPRRRRRRQHRQGHGRARRHCHARGRRRLAHPGRRCLGPDEPQGRPRFRQFRHRRAPGARPHGLYAADRALHRRCVAVETADGPRHRAARPDRRPLRDSGRRKAAAHAPWRAPRRADHLQASRRLGASQIGGSSSPASTRPAAPPSSSRKPHATIPSAC